MLRKCSEGLLDVQLETWGSWAPKSRALNKGPKHRRTCPTDWFVHRFYSQGGGWAHLQKVGWERVETHGL